jgi:sigma-B regulation protein RsbU (phosphoserine phosphatase)
MEGIGRAGAQAWNDLLVLSRDEASERPMMERLLGLWRREHGVEAAGLYLERGGRLEREAAVGEGLPEVLEGDAPDGLGSLQFPGGRLVFLPAGPAADGDGAIGAMDAADDPLTLLLAAALKSCRLKYDLKDQQFQVNYRVVELEALYDVGLAVASTLDLDRLSEEILLRAVSLLDARRGALYILEDGRYRLEGTFGGEAAPSFAGGDGELRQFLVAGGEAPAHLLPGARYLQGVPIEVESGPRGLIAVGDKESRRGVGPFLASDRRTLSLFANQAALALENARLHLQALEKERLEREMHLAAEIQRQILPKGAPIVDGFELIGWYRPARQVGGDYYDLFRREDGRIGLVVGDVSGKGMPAALMVSILHSALRLLLDQTGFGPAMLERLNRHIGDSSASNKFITMLLAELDPATGVLHYMNAGHNPAILLRADGRVEELPAGGMPIGLMPEARFQSRALTMERGDLLCIYSDGITEAAAPDDEEFGMGRLTEHLRAGQGRSLAELVESIPQAIGEFSQGLPQGDDQTLVLLRRV